MYRKSLSAVLPILITLAGNSSAGAIIRGTVLEVTPDAIKVKSDSGTATYALSNNLLTNTVPLSHNPLRGKITEVKPGNKILLEYEKRAGKSICFTLEVSK